MPDYQTNVVVAAPKAPDPALNPMAQYGMGGAMMPQMSGEGYKLIDRLVDPNALYLDKLWTLLYNAHLMKVGISDPDSPVPGYKMMKVGGTKWKPNMSLNGATTTISECLLALSEDGSVTRFPNDFQLSFFCARQTMSIIGMMMANREEWEFTNYTLIYPFGHTLWKSMVAVLSRSRSDDSKRTLMDMLVHPNLWFNQGMGGNDQPKRKWFDL